MTQNDRLNSYQFLISQEIFARRIHKNWTRQQAAYAVGLTKEEYTKFEQGIIDKTKNDYESILEKLR